MEGIEIIFQIDRILVNRKRHMYGIADMDVRWFYHMIYIDRVVHHCMSNSSHGIPDTCREHTDVQREKLGRSSIYSLA